jgi:hypothetical protein
MLKDVAMRAMLLPLSSATPRITTLRHLHAMFDAYATMLLSPLLFRHDTSLPPRVDVIASSPSRTDDDCSRRRHAILKARRRDCRRRDFAESSSRRYFAADDAPRDMMLFATPAAPRALALDTLRLSMPPPRAAEPMVADAAPPFSPQPLLAITLQ